MIDMEKVIGHLNACMESSRRDNTWVFVRKDVVEDTITMLKEQKPKKGHWIVLEFCANEGIYCSECHMKIFDRTTMPKKKLSQYCPHCGSRNDQFFRDGEVVFR